MNTTTVYELQWRRGEGWAIWHTYDPEWTLSEVQLDSRRIRENNPVLYFRLVKLIKTVKVVEIEC